MITQIPHKAPAQAKWNKPESGRIYLKLSTAMARQQHIYNNLLVPLQHAVGNVLLIHKEGCLMPPKWKSGLYESPQPP